MSLRRAGAGKEATVDEVNEDKIPTKRKPIRAMLRRVGDRVNEVTEDNINSTQQLQEGVFDTTNQFNQRRNF
jgi:hypothetical protein